MADLGVDEQLAQLKRDRPRRLQPGAATGRIKYLVLAAALIIAAVFAVMSGSKSVYLIKVGDTVLGQVADQALKEEILSKIVEEEVGRTGCQICVQQDIQLIKAKPDKNIKTLTSEELEEALRDHVLLAARGFVVNVNGEDIVALKTEEEAKGVLSDLREEYINTVIGASATIEEIAIKEQVDFQEKDIPTKMFRDREDAVKVLSRGTDRTLNYSVESGDSLWAIAERNHLSVDDLIKANPQVEPDLIQIGQNLNLVVPEPYVTLISKELVTNTVSIPYPVHSTGDSSMWPWEDKVTQAGKVGQKEITEEIVRENGQVISRVILYENVLSQPVPQKVLRGTKQVPNMSSGSMLWPLQGTITSRFGYRWGAFHQGVDIGAPVGTEIYAADSGMVSMAAWDGGYGYCVRVDHGNGIVTVYGHMSKFAVSKGDKVGKGQVLGYVGSTGNSTGPHLHFEIRIDGSAVDPVAYYEQ